MNLKDAYTILELNSSATPEELKKKYRELSKKWHPDINKEPSAEDKFKKINEAYQLIQKGEVSEAQNYTDGPFRYNVHFERPQVLENIDISITIDFKESVLGCKKTTKYNRKTKCPDCNGNGQTKIDNGCKKCNGRGQVTFKQQGAVFVSTCPDCHGKSNFAQCAPCNSSGCVSAQADVNMAIPAGIINGTILRLQGMGHFAGSFMGLMDQYTDVFCSVNVVPDSELILQGQDVVSKLKINLLDALQGGEWPVKTINGMETIKVPSQSKHHDEIVIKHLGVNKIGNQKIILDVDYPANIEKLISHLQNEGK